MILKTGKMYDVGVLRITGWTDGDGSGHEGYGWREYFDDDGRYLGPDQHGIEPVFSESESESESGTVDQLGRKSSA